MAAGPERLLPAGLTRQKTRYLLGLSRDVLDGRLDLDALASADDGTARQQLLGFVGIGPWTADIYLLMALGRPDIWPVGDLALATAMRRAKRLAAVPRSDEQAGDGRSVAPAACRGGAHPVARVPRGRALTVVTARRMRIEA